jgi:hypothetical protein
VLINIANETTKEGHIKYEIGRLSSQRMRSETDRQPLYSRGDWGMPHSLLNLQERRLQIELYVARSSRALRPFFLERFLAPICG